MTTTKTPEQEANELVEMFKARRVGIFTRLDSVPYMVSGIPYLISGFLTPYSAAELAVLHVERLIEVLSKRCSLGGYTRDQIEHYQQVLSILKDKK